MEGRGGGTGPVRRQRQELRNKPYERPAAQAATRPVKPTPGANDSRESSDADGSGTGLLSRVAGFLLPGWWGSPSKTPPPSLGADSTTSAGRSSPYSASNGTSSSLPKAGSRTFVVPLVAPPAATTTTTTSTSTSTTTSGSSAVGTGAAYSTSSLSSSAQDAPSGSRFTPQPPQSPAAPRAEDIAKMIENTPGTISHAEFERLQAALLKRVENPVAGGAAAPVTPPAAAPAAVAPFVAPATSTTPFRPIARRGQFVTPTDVVRTFLHKRPPGPGRELHTPTVAAPASARATGPLGNTFSAAASPSPYDAPAYNERQFERTEPYATGRVARVRDPYLGTPIQLGRQTLGAATPAAALRQPQDRKRGRAAYEEQDSSDYLATPLRKTPQPPPRIEVAEPASKRRRLGVAPGVGVGGYASHTAQRILKTLDEMSSPLVVASPSSARHRPITNTPTFGAGTTPTFGAGTTPTFGTGTFGTTKDDAASKAAESAAAATTPAPSLDKSLPSFGASIAGSTASATDGSASKPTFGTGATSMFGSGTTPTFGAGSTPTFGAGTTPTFGSGATPTFGAGTTPTFGSGATPTFGAGTTPTFGSFTPGVSSFTPKSPDGEKSKDSAKLPAFGIGTAPATPTFGAGATPTFGSSTASAASSSSADDKSTSKQSSMMSFGSGTTPTFGSTTSTTTPAFGAGTTPAFGAGTTPTFGAGTTPAFGAGTTPTFGAGTTPTFGAGTTPAFGAGTTPTFGAGTTPAFGSGATSTFGSGATPAFGSGTTPAFGSGTTPAFGSGATSTFGSGTTPAFGAGTTPAFGSGPTSTFGSGATPAFGAGTTPAFGSGPTPTFGSGATPAFGSGTTPAFGSGAGMFGAGATPTFGGATPTFGAQSTAFGAPAPGAAQPERTDDPVTIQRRVKKKAKKS